MPRQGEDRCRNRQSAHRSPAAGRRGNRWSKQSRRRIARRSRRPCSPAYLPGPKPLIEAMMMRGLIFWIRSQEKPIRSSAPGAKFSTSTSHSSTSRVSTSLPVVVLGVQLDRALVVVQHGEIQAVRTRHIDQLLARRVADTGTFDLDHIRAEPGQQLRAGRARLNMGEIEYLDAFESFHCVLPVD